MPVKIRLMRIGARKRPFYRVVAVSEQKKRTGGYLELLGTYNPLTEPKEVILKQDRIDHWKKNGAVLSDGFLRIIGQAPQRPPRKAKKEKKSTADSPQATAEKTVNETSKGEDVNEAQSALSGSETEGLPGEGDQSAEVLTSTTSDEPVITEGEETSLADKTVDAETETAAELENQSQTSDDKSEDHKSEVKTEETVEEKK